jgi:hypothetical protein
MCISWGKWSCLNNLNAVKEKKFSMDDSSNITWSKKYFRVTQNSIYKVPQITQQFGVQFCLQVGPRK